ncbi:MAG: hypothetical protein U1E45_23335 [Geminicoccaceae bacterium]
MRKKVSFGVVPKTQQTPDPDAWVERRVESEPLKRLTIDIPKGLHARIKSQCALRGTKMVEEIRMLLEEAYPES